MVGWHGHEFEQTPGDGKGQGSLACCSPWAHKELGMTEWLTTTNVQATNVQAIMTSPHLHMWRYFPHHFPFWLQIFQQTKVYVPQSQGEFCLPALGPGHVCARPPLYLPNYPCVGETDQILWTSSKTYWWKRLWRVCILSVRLNCYIRIVHVLFAAKFKRAVLYIMSSFTLTTSLDNFLFFWTFRTKVWLTQ